MEFSRKNLEEIMLECAVFEEEVYYETRKGIPQTFYVLEIPRGSCFWNWESDQMEHVPEWSIGYWKTQFADDNNGRFWREAIKNQDWVRAEKKEVVTYVWEQA